MCAFKSCGRARRHYFLPLRVAYQAREFTTSSLLLCIMNLLLIWFCSRASSAPSPAPPALPGGIFPRNTDVCVFHGRSWSWRSGADASVNRGLPAPPLQHAQTCICRAFQGGEEKKGRNSHWERWLPLFNFSKHTLVFFGNRESIL